MNQKIKQPMTRRRIEQYIKLQREIIMLEEQILSAETSGGEYLSEVVQGSSVGTPYKKHSIVIKGYGSNKIPRLLKLKAKYEFECDAVERYIEALDDSATRQLLTRRYIEDRPMKEVAHILGYSERQAFRLIKTFFEKLPGNGR